MDKFGVVIAVCDVRNSAELEFGPTGGSLWQPHCPQEQPASPVGGLELASPGGFGIDPRLGAAALRAPAASREDFCPQAPAEKWSIATLEKNKVCTKVLHLI